MAKHPCIYILASRRNGTLYIGVTSDLHLRMQQHTQGLVAGFSKRHGIKILVYCEYFDSMGSAIRRETRLKKWNRLWKLRLIGNMNPEWVNLYNPETGEIGFGSSDTHAREEPAAD